MSTKQKWTLSLLAMTLFGLAATGLSQPTPPNDTDRWVEIERLDGPIRLDVITWLSRDCEAKEERILLERFWSVGTELQPVFWEAYRQGPPPQVVEAGHTAAANAFEERQNWLRQEGEDLMSPEEVTGQLEVSAEDYIQRQVENAGQGWRERALVALGVVGDDKALGELLRIAESDAPGAAAATRGLEERKAFENGGGTT